MKAIFLIFVGATAGAAHAQALQDVPQVSAEGRSVEVGTQLSQPLTDARGQSAAEGLNESLRTGQLTSDGASSQAPKQLSSRTRNTQAPASISHPAEGRTAAVERVEGADRCDPATRAEKRAPECKKVIETRAAEYAHARPVELTPEQRLLIDQEARASASTLADATHRLASTGEADDSPESLAIASIVLARPAPPPEPKKDEDPTANAAVQAVIQLVTQTPPK